MDATLTISVGSLGMVTFPAGRYVYVGSACRGVAGRIARHRRLAEHRNGKVHWHIDYLLINPHVRWAGEAAMEDGFECTLSEGIASRKGATVPVPGFGSSDCRAGCEAHLYRLPDDSDLMLGLKDSKAWRIRRRR